MKSTWVTIQQKWWTYLRSEYTIQAVHVFYTYSRQTHTHKQIMSDRSTVVITSTSKVLQATLSNPVLFLSFPLPFPFHGQSSFCSFYSPAWKVHHPHHLSEWHLWRRSPELGLTTTKRICVFERERDKIRRENIYFLTTNTITMPTLSKSTQSLTNKFFCPPKRCFCLLGTFSHYLTPPTTFTA